MLAGVTRIGPALGSTNYLGSDCSGSSGDVNRTLDVSSGSPVIVVLEGSVLQPSTQYSLSGSVITFLVPVLDAMNVTVFK